MPVIISGVFPIFLVGCLGGIYNAIALPQPFLRFNAHSAGAIEAV